MTYPVDDVRDHRSRAIGELRICREFIEQQISHSDNDIGTALDLCGAGVEKPYFQFGTPKHASSKPISVNVWDTESETGSKLSL
jgi:hypothetical protein